MSHHQTDYLIIGAGAAGLAFADTLLEETDAHITIVDRRGKPGGHWNDAYSFVALHQPSAFYGVNSLELGTNSKDSFGVNKGLYELASGPEVSGYFGRVMHQKLLPSGRVSYHPMSDYLGDGRFVSLLSGAQTEVTVRKRIVDATYYSPAIPSTHKPKYRVTEGVRMVPPNALPGLWQHGGDRQTHFAVIGAGKTAMDAVIWLLQSGALPDSISWVVPRDSWLVNRLHTQPGIEFFKESMGGQADLMEAMASATTVEDLFAQLEASGQMLRIDQNHKPAMFHYATMSTGEVDLLRQVRNVIRKGHVQAVEIDGLVLDQGRVAMDPGTLYIDCTASAVEQRTAQPIFQPGKLVLQLVRAPLPTFSAALVAWVEAHLEDDKLKNRMCSVVPFPTSPAGYVGATMVSMMNQFQWAQDKALRAWMRNSRLDGFSKMVAAVDPLDTEKTDILNRMRTQAMAAMANAPKLMAQSA